MGQVWLAVNRFATARGVWTVVRVAGDSYQFREQIKAFGAFRYGYPFDRFVAYKQEAGIEDAAEFRKWLDANGDKREKAWACYYTGEPAENRETVEKLAADLGQRCGTVFAIRETAPVTLAPVEPAGGKNGVGLGDEDVAPAGPAEPEGWTDPDCDADLPF